MRKKGASVVVVTLLLCSLAIAQNAQPLRYNWQAGQTLTWQVLIEGNGNTTISMGGQSMPSPQSLKLQAIMVAQVLEVSPDKQAKVNVRLGPLEYSLQMGQAPPMSGKVDPDAGTGQLNAVQMTQFGMQPQTVQVPAEVLTALKTGFLAIVDDRGEPKGQEGIERFMQAVATLQGGAAIMGPIQALLITLPAEPLAPGQQWQVQTPAVQGLPPQTIQFRYAGVENFANVPCHKIESILQLTLQNMPMPQMMPGLSGTVTTATSKIQNTHWLSAQDSHVLAFQSLASEESQAKMTMQMATPQGAAPGGGLPQGGPMGADLQTQTHTKIQAQRK